MISGKRQEGRRDRKLRDLFRAKITVGGLFGLVVSHGRRRPAVSAHYAAHPAFVLIDDDDGGDFSEDVGDGADAAEVDAGAVSSPNGADDLAIGSGEDRAQEDEQAQPLPAPRGVEAKDPFELPAEMLDVGNVDALPGPKSVDQIKAEAEAAAQKMLTEGGTP